jgi:hypothetical protein
MYLHWCSSKCCGNSEVLFAFQFLNVAIFICHGDTAIIVYKVLLVNIA